MTKKLVTTTIIGLSILFLLIGCEDKNIPPPKFHRGDFVTSRLTGDKGQVTYICGHSKSGRSYYVRFAVTTTYTDSRLISSDGPMKISPFIELRMQEFELERFLYD